MDKINLVLATRNLGKISQIKRVFAGFDGVRIHSQDELGIEESAEEDGSTLLENARKKAHFVHKKLSELGMRDFWVVADDSGLFIQALGGRPGIFSARWAGENATTNQITNFTLEQMRGVPYPNRLATEKTLAFLASPDDLEFGIFNGELFGRITLERRGLTEVGMPYSPIFEPLGQEVSPKTLAEMPPERVVAISHRGKAFKKVRKCFERYMRLPR